jgi:hypothetical protein
MATLQWDQVGDRVYENGLDRGVLYLPDGSGVVWNGLTEVQQKFDQKTTPVYFDGRKINDLVTLGTFTASMKAITYPDEFVEVEGLAALRPGLYLGDQPLKTFGLCYRTHTGNDFDGIDGYKLHVVYNLTAIPSDTSYTSLSDSPELVEFEWDLTSIPADTPGFRETSHLIVDSRSVDPWLLADIEDILYGDSDADAALLPIDDLIAYLDEWFRLQIVDHGNGTWSAIEYKEGTNIIFLPDGEFEIINCNAIYTVEDVEFIISDTLDVADIPTIDITDHNNGTWTAQTSVDALIEMIEPDLFAIHDANVFWVNEFTYQISDTYPTSPSGMATRPTIRNGIEED